MKKTVLKFNNSCCQIFCDLAIIGINIKKKIKQNSKYLSSKEDVFTKYLLLQLNNEVYVFCFSK